MKTKTKKTKTEKEEKKEFKKNPNVNIKAEIGRLIGRSYYDHQGIRIAEFNRIRDIVYRKMEGLNLTEIQEKKPEEEKYLEKYTDKYLNEYLRILRDEDKITQRELDYLTRCFEVLKNAEKFENEYKKFMEEIVKDEPIYIQYLEKIRGISTVISSNLIKEFGYCENSPYISSVWKWSGLSVEDGEAQKRKRGEKLNYSPSKKKLLWIITDSFIKQRTPVFRDIYNKEKEKQLKLLEVYENQLKNKKQEDNVNHLKNETHNINVNQENNETHFNFVNQPMNETHHSFVSLPKSKMHCENRARRKVSKIFIATYWQCCKELTQTDKTKIPKTYVEEHLNHKHIINWKEVVLKQQLKKPDDVLKVKRGKKNETI